MPKHKKKQVPKEIPEYIVVTDLLDLHGFLPEQIPEAVNEFIRNAVELKLKQVQIVHGKGKSKLKYLVRKELSQNKNVVEFRDALPAMGGWGRTVVTLHPKENAVNTD